MEESFFQEYKTRTGWLLIGLIGSFAIAKLISSFEETLSQNIFLIYFIPLIVYISDAVGTQTESIIIRTISNDKNFHLGIFFKKQLLLTLAIGSTLAVVSFLIVLLLSSDVRVSLTICLGLFFSIFTALITGILVPYYFWKFHQDPAEASGPIATVIQDFLSILVFFLVAQALL